MAVLASACAAGVEARAGLKIYALVGYSQDKASTARFSKDARVALTKQVDAQVFKQVKRQRPCVAYLSSDDRSTLLDHEKQRQLLRDPSIGDPTQFAGAVGARYAMALKVAGAGSKIFIRGSTIDTKRAKARAKRNPYANNPDEAVDVINEFAAELVSSSDLPVCRTGWAGAFSIRRTGNYAGEPRTAGDTNKRNTATGTDFNDESLEAAIELVPGKKPAVHFEISFNQLSAAGYGGGCNGREEGGFQMKAAGDSPIEGRDQLRQGWAGPARATVARGTPVAVLRRAGRSPMGNHTRGQDRFRRVARHVQGEEPLQLEGSRGF